MINFSHQAEVGNLEQFAVSDENISCSEVSMNKSLLGKVILRDKKRWIVRE